MDSFLVFSFIFIIGLIGFGIFLDRKYHLSAYKNVLILTGISCLYPIILLYSAGGGESGGFAAIVLLPLLLLIIVGGGSTALILKMIDYFSKKKNK